MTLLLSLIFIGAILLAVLLIFGGFVPVSSRQVSIQVKIKLTDLDYKPLVNEPVRLVFPCNKGWQDAKAGYPLVTDTNGEGQVTAQVVIDRRWRKMPTNFIGSLIGPPMLTDHLAVGAEMEYTEFHRLYVTGGVLFPDGTTMQDPFSVYTPDAQGNFTDQPEMINGDWKFKELKGLMVTGPGYQPYGVMLSHDDKGGNWTLELAFRKSPPPVMR